MIKPKLYIVVNYDWFFLSHRKTVAIRAKENGYHVTVVAGDYGNSSQIKSLGLDFIRMEIKPAGTNLLLELQTFLFLLR